MFTLGGQKKKKEEKKKVKKMTASLSLTRLSPQEWGTTWSYPLLAVTQGGCGWLTNDLTQ